MKTRFFGLILLLVPGGVRGQSFVWVNVEEGAALFMDPERLEWTPVTGKERLQEQTFMLTQPGAEVTLFKEADAYRLPAAGYFYLADVPEKNAVEVVGALTRIEAEHLPAPARRSDDRRTVGLTYGKPYRTEEAEQSPIPYEAERLAAVAWFSSQGRTDAALLSLKRTMTRYPDLYADLAYVERLWQLYDALGLYGFILDESKRLLEAEDAAPQYERALLRWHALASEKLLRRE